jgi:hypothetical protein
MWNLQNGSWKKILLMPNSAWSETEREPYQDTVSVRRSFAAKIQERV